MPAYDLPKIENYPTLLKSPVVIEQRLSAEEVKKLRQSPLELILAQNKVAPNNNSNGPCIVDGQSVDNCVDLIYQRTNNTNEIYKEAKVVGRNTMLASRYKFVFFDEGEWEDYFFNKGELSTKMHNILKEDKKIDFDALYRFFKQFNGKIERVALFREGYMAVGIGKGNIGGYLIPISPETVDKIKGLYL